MQTLCWLNNKNVELGDDICNLQISALKADDLAPEAVIHFVFTVYKCSYSKCGFYLCYINFPNVWKRGQGPYHPNAALSVAYLYLQTCE